MDAKATSMSSSINRTSDPSFVGQSIDPRSGGNSAELSKVDNLRARSDEIWWCSPRKAPGGVIVCSDCGWAKDCPEVVHSCVEPSALVLRRIRLLSDKRTPQLAATCASQHERVKREIASRMKCESRLSAAEAKAAAAEAKASAAEAKASAAEAKAATFADRLCKMEAKNERRRAKEDGVVATLKGLTDSPRRARMIRSFLHPDKLGEGQKVGAKRLRDLMGL